MNVQNVLILNRPTFNKKYILLENTTIHEMLAVLIFFRSIDHMGLETIIFEFLTICVISKQF